MSRGVELLRYDPTGLHHSAFDPALPERQRRLSWLQWQRDFDTVSSLLFPLCAQLS